MGGLDHVGKVVRAARLGAAILALIVAVAGSWAALQPGYGQGAASARAAAINPTTAQTTPYVAFIRPPGSAASAVCLPPAPVDEGSKTIAYWQAMRSGPKLLPCGSARAISRVPQT